MVKNKTESKKNLHEPKFFVKKTKNIKKKSKKTRGLGSYGGIPTQSAHLVANYLLQNEKGNFRGTSTDINSEVGKECDGVDFDYIGIDYPPFENKNIAIFWKTIENPNKKRGSNSKCWKKKSSEELVEEYQNDLQKYEAMISENDLSDFENPNNNFQENLIAILALAKHFSNYSLFIEFLDRTMHMRKLLNNTELLEHIFHFFETAGVNVNQGDAETGRTGLLIAVYNQYKNIMTLLLKNKNIDVNKGDNDGLTPLMLASGNGYKEIVELFLKNENIDVNKGDNFGHTPLSLASRFGFEKIVTLLLSNDNIDLNKVDNRGATPLLVASGFGNTHIISLLLEKGADVNRSDYREHSPLYQASSMGHEGVVALLLKNDRIDVNQTDTVGTTPLIIASQKNFMSIVILLLRNGNVDMNKGDQQGATPLLAASAHNNVEIVQLLLDNGADINKGNDEAVTPLYIASKNGCTDVVELLLKNEKIDMTKVTINGISPLRIANMKGHRDIVAQLKNRLDSARQ